MRGAAHCDRAREEKRGGGRAHHERAARRGRGSDTDGPGCGAHAFLRIAGAAPSPTRHAPVVFLCCVRAADVAVRRRFPPPLRPQHGRC